MGSLGFSFLASGCTALASLCFRKSGDCSKETLSGSGYLVVFYLFSFAFSVLFFPSIWQTSINFIILSIGALVGLLSSTLMLLTSHALKCGPAGLTFAFQNASAVFPGLILFLLLGSDFGFSCSYLQLSGMAIVLLGLFLGAKSQSTPEGKGSFKWLKYALACFFIQILALTFIQARCILFDCDGSSGFTSDFTLSEADDVWFMPGQFAASFMMQALIFWKESKKLKIQEISYGSLGGIANFGSTGLLLLATKLALPFEKGIVFPCFAVASMVLCNFWANRLYKENFNFKSNTLCSIGIFMAVAE